MERDVGKDFFFFLLTCINLSDGQGGLACCDSWGRKELDTTERLNWTELINLSDVR